MHPAYECGICHNNTLVLRSVSMDGNLGWEVMCGRGHPLVPVPGFEITTWGDSTK